MGSLRKRKLELIEPEVEMPKYAKTRSRIRRRYAPRRRLYRFKKAYLKRRYKRKPSTLMMKKRAIPETKRVTTTTEFATTFRPFGLSNAGTPGQLQINYDGSLGEAQFFPAISKGINVNNRIGDKVQSIALRAVIRISGQSSLQDEIRYRIIIFRKKRDTTNGLLITDFLHFDPFNANRYSVSSRRKEDTYRDYIVHYDRTFKAPAEQIAGANFTRDHKIVLKLGHTIMFDDTSAVNGTEYGDMGLICLTNVGDVGTSTGLRAQVTSTLYFIDP